MDPHIWKNAEYILRETRQPIVFLLGVGYWAYVRDFIRINPSAKDKSSIVRVEFSLTELKQRREQIHAEFA